MDDFPNDQTNLRQYDGDETKESGELVSQKGELDYKNLVSKLEKELIVKDKIDGAAHSELSRRDPEEEFFMLAVLALKMCHNE